MLGPRREWFTTLAYDIDSHKIRNLMEGVGHAMNVVFGPPEVRTVDRHPMAYREGIYLGTVTTAAVCSPSTSPRVSPGGAKTGGAFRHAPLPPAYANGGMCPHRLKMER